MDAMQNCAMGALSAARVVEEFRELWRSSDLQDKMPEPGLFVNGPLVELNSIGVYGPHQGRHYGSRALRMLTTLCDANGVTITLIARPLDARLLDCPATRSTDELVSWYQRHGFVETTTPGDDTRMMVREPREADAQMKRHHLELASVNSFRIVHKAELTEEQARHLDERLAADIHRNDAGPQRSWDQRAWEPRLYAALKDGTPVGIVYIGGPPDGCDVAWWLDSACRGKRYGSAMIDVLAPYLKGLGYQRIGKIWIEGANAEERERSAALVRRLKAHFRGSWS